MPNSIYIGFRVDFSPTLSLDIDKVSHIPSLMIREIALKFVQNNNCFYKFLLPYIDTVALKEDCSAYELIGNKMLLHLNESDIPNLETIYDDSIKKISHIVGMLEYDIKKIVKLSVFKIEHTPQGLKAIVQKLFEVNPVETLCSMKNFSPKRVYISATSNINLLCQTLNDDSKFRKFSGALLSFCEIANRYMSKKGCTFNYSCDGEILVSLPNELAKPELLDYIREYIQGEWQDKLCNNYPLKELEIAIYA